jgi:hypothetical protein
MINTGTVSAFILFVVMSLLPIFVREFRNSMRIMLAYWFVISIHQTVSLINTYLFPIYGAGLDAFNFHNSAVALAQSEEFYISVGAIFYKNMLGLAYRIFGSSQLLGSQLSNLAFAVSCILLVKIMGFLKLPHYRTSALLVFGGLPSMVMLGSVTLREPSQILFFMLAVYFGVKMHKKTSTKFCFVLMVVSALLMGMFHFALMAYGACLIALFIFWAPNPTIGLKLNKRHLVLGLSILTILVGIIYMAKVPRGALGGLFYIDNNVLETTMTFRKTAVSIDARATYGVLLDLSSTLSTAYTGFLLYMHYLFAPFPWQVKSIVDVFGFLESMLRMTLIYFSVKHWRITQGAQRQTLKLMLILYFTMSFMWALGTVNYGTALRHNMLTWWILIIAGFPLLMKQLCPLLKLLMCRRSYPSESVERTS